MKHMEGVDVCVVGGGMSGLLIADKLAAQGKRIAIVEQGPSYPLSDRAKLIERQHATIGPADFNDGLAAKARMKVATSGDSPFAVKLGGIEQGKLEAKPGLYAWRYFHLSGLGGSTKHWGAQSPRPVADDLATRTKFKYGRDWPMAWEELERYLGVAEVELGVAGNDDNPYASARSTSFPMKAHAFSHFDQQVMMPAFSKLGWKTHSNPVTINSQEYNGLPACSGCRKCFYCPSGARYSADLVQGARTSGHDNVQTLLGLHARALEFSDRGDRAVAVHANRVDDGSEIVVPAKEIVLAMGPVETPRMLLLSNYKGSGHEHIGVGFTDHIMKFCQMELSQKTGTRLGYATMRSDHFCADGQTERPHSRFELTMAPMVWEMPQRDAFFRSRMEKTGTLSKADLLQFARSMVCLFTTIETEGKGRARLSESEKDDWGDPILETQIELTERDFAGVEAFMKSYLSIADAMDARHTKVADGFFFPQHAAGATAMGATPEQGVCDQNLRVFGVRNLHLASASVFPQYSVAPPTLTAAALALRLADHLGSKSP